MKNRKRAVIILAVVIAAVLAALAVKTAVGSNLERQKQKDIEANVTPEEYIEGLVNVDGQWYIPIPKLETILLIGIDEYEQAEHEAFTNTQQADFLALLLVNHADKSYSVMHINRDTMCDVSIIGMDGIEAGTSFEQIALSHTYGSGLKDSCRNTRKSVSNLMYNIRIDSYASIPMSAIAMLNDAVGGVEVTLEDDFTHIYPTWTIGSTVTLHGDEAETFVRSRGSMSEPTNINRMSRQLVYINAWMDKARDKARGNSDFALNTFLDLGDKIVSDMSVYKMSDLANAISDYEFKGNLNIVGEAKRGEMFMEFYPDEELLKKQVLKNFYIEYEMPENSG